MFGIKKISRFFVSRKSKGIFNITVTKQKFKKRFSPTKQKFMDIIENMATTDKTYTYDDIIEAIWGRTDDRFRKFYQKVLVARYFRYMRRKFLLHIYQIGESVRVLKTKEQFNTIIEDHERKIEGLKKVIAQLEKDKANVSSGVYAMQLKERLGAYKSTVGR